MMPLNRQEIDKLLKTEELVYIATTKKNGNSHIAPVWFVYQNGKIYFETDRNTVKFHNIKSRNKVAFCFSGKPAYIIEGSLRWWAEKEAPVPFRKLLWEKYGRDMDDSYPRTRKPRSLTLGTNGCFWGFRYGVSD